MTTGDWAFLLLLLIVLLCSMVCALAWKIAYADGHEDGRLYERNRQNMRRIRDNRTRPHPAMVPALVGGQPPWSGTVAIRSTRTEHMIAMPAPVTEPIAHPGAGRNPYILSGSGFQIVAKATTDQYIAQMQRAEDEYRKALTS